MVTDAMLAGELPVVTYVESNRRYNAARNPTPDSSQGQWRVVAWLGQGTEPRQRSIFT